MRATIMPGIAMLLGFVVNAGAARIPDRDIGQMPRELLGEWCYAREYPTAQDWPGATPYSVLWKRGGCKIGASDGNWLIIKGRRYTAFEIDCRITRITISGGAYRVAMQCTGLDEKFKQTLWINEAMDNEMMIHSAE
jgi:hypothetical protein